MKKSDIKLLINNSIGQRQLCRVKFDYDDNTWFVFPLITSDKLFLCANEGEFLLNGYSIRRFKDVKKAEYQEGKILSMIQAEKIDKRTTIPDIDMSVLTHDMLMYFQNIFNFYSCQVLKFKTLVFRF